MKRRTRFAEKNACAFERYWWLDVYVDIGNELYDLRKGIMYQLMAGRGRLRFRMAVVAARKYVFAGPVGIVADCRNQFFLTVRSIRVSQNVRAKLSEQHKQKQCRKHESQMLSLC